MCVLKSSNNLGFMKLISYPEIGLEENTFTFITGESGCGKSTYLKMLNATVIPSDGTIEYRGRCIHELDIVGYRKKVMLLPQEVFLFDGTIRENFDLYYAGRGENRLDEGKIKSLLTTCCAEYPLDTQCKILSGGERQRVFTAIFLSFLPDVILLDEPTSALDENTSAAFISNIKSFCKSYKMTGVVVCHNKSMAEQFADHTVVLKRG